MDFLMKVALKNISYISPEAGVVYMSIFTMEFLRVEERLKLMIIEM